MYIGNLDERVTDALVWELMLQAGRIVSSQISVLRARFAQAKANGRLCERL